MKKIAIAFLTILCMIGWLMVSSSQLYSQQSDSNDAGNKGLFIGFKAGSSKSHIVNEGTFTGSGLHTRKMNTINGSVETGYFFSRYFGLSTGIGIDAYQTELTLDTYENKFNTTDSESESYERRVTGTDIKEIQKIDFLTVPLCLNFRLPFTTTLGFFVQTGAELAIPVNKSYSSAGTFTHKGYYPAYNVLLENLPAYGFPANYLTMDKGEPVLQDYTIQAIASAGIDLRVMEKLQVGVAAFYRKSLSKVSSYGSADLFRLSPDVDQLNSLMGGCSKVSLQSMGISLSVRYYLGR